MMAESTAYIILRTPFSIIHLKVNTVLTRLIDKLFIAVLVAARETPGA